MASEILDALKKLRQKSKKRKFNQSIDLIINLRKCDIRKNNVNLSLKLPHKVKESKIAAFLKEKSNLVDSIVKADFDKYIDKKKIKKLVRDYDYFIAFAGVMPAVATSFGKYLGPLGKMPAPGLGIILNDNEESIKKEIEKFEGILKIKTKEPSIKVIIGKEDMKDEDIANNIELVYKAVLDALPKFKQEER